MLPRSRVLIAEDEPLTALDIAATVRETGGEVLGPAASVSEALDLLEESRIDGAILDCNLPDNWFGDCSGSMKVVTVARGHDRAFAEPKGVLGALTERLTKFIHFEEF